MKRKIQIILLVCSLGGISVFAGEPPVKVEGAWLRAVPPSSSNTAAYMKLTNTSDQPLRLVSAKTEIAGMVMPMITTHSKMYGADVTGMKTVDGLAIPALGQLQLAPDGDHLMVMMLKEHPKEGAKVKLTLHFEPGAIDLTVELPMARRQP